MSGLKPPEMSAFYRKIQARGLTTEILANQLSVTRPALCRVLNGSRRRGFIWKKVTELLTPEELALLDVAHRHPWNRKRTLARPKWNDGRNLLAHRAERMAS
jgi:hypothetical protein